MSKISICIASNKKEVDKQVAAIKRTATSKDFEVIVSCQDTTCGGNRNYCLDRASGDIIIMMDDDISGFFKGWDEVLIKPLEDDSVSIVSARLNIEMGYEGSGFNIVGGGCTAFRKTGMRNDEMYEKGFEDTDWCLQMELAHPGKHVVINDNCKLKHPPIIDKRKERLPDRKRFVDKWGWVHNRKKPDRTIIYYTASTEKESFEKSVIENILRASGNLPIISVSQKPLDFGKNICVGELGQNYTNAFKQALIGCEAATTPYVVMTESDCLYPEKGYFDFIPKDPNIMYSYKDVWLMWNRVNRTRFYSHGTTGGSVITGRELYIKILKEKIKGVVGFNNPDLTWEFFGGDPLVNVKTRDGVSFGTTLKKGVKPKHELKGFGTVEDVKNTYEI